MDTIDLTCPFSSAKCRGSECVFWSADDCILLEAPLSSMELEDKLDETNEKLDDVSDKLDAIAKLLFEM